MLLTPLLQSQRMVEQHHRTQLTSMFPGTQMASEHVCMHSHDLKGSPIHVLHKIFVRDHQRCLHHPRMVLPDSESH